MASAGAGHYQARAYEDLRPCQGVIEGGYTAVHKPELSIEAALPWAAFVGAVLLLANVLMIRLPF
jgi:hypothetical protein